MEIKSVFDKEFTPYGQVHEGYELAGLLAAMKAIPLPEEGTAYQPAIQALEAQGVFRQFEESAYGGMPIQIGMCWGRNTRLNCLEYHRDSEFNVGANDFILLLANTLATSASPTSAPTCAKRWARANTTRTCLSAWPSLN